MTFDISLLSLFRPDLFKVKLTPVESITLPVSKNETDKDEHS